MLRYSSIRSFFVAPHAGARIETLRALRASMGNQVAPHAGARIETRHQSRCRNLKRVAPHAGARIETMCWLRMVILPMSLPMRERELKPARTERQGCWDVVAPHAGARQRSGTSLSSRCSLLPRGCWCNRESPAPHGEIKNTRYQLGRMTAAVVAQVPDRCCISINRRSL